MKMIKQHHQFPVATMESRAPERILVQPYPDREQLVLPTTRPYFLPVDRARQSLPLRRLSQTNCSLHLLKRNRTNRQEGRASALKRAFGLPAYPTVCQRGLSV